MLKHRVGAILLVALILFSSFAFFTLPAHAAGSTCWLFDYSVTNLFDETATETAEFFDFVTGAVYGSSSITLNPGESGVNHLVALIPDDAFFDVRYSGRLMDEFDVLFAGPSADACNFGSIGDGRINDGPDQLAAPLAAYCVDGGIAVWDIAEDGQGTLGFTASADEITAALASAVSSAQNVLVGEGLGNSLYALSTNELSLIGPDVKEPGKTYSYVTAGDVCA